LFLLVFFCLCPSLAAAAALTALPDSYWISVQKICSRCAVVWSGDLKFTFNLSKGFHLFCTRSFVRLFDALLISIVREAAASKKTAGADFGIGSIKRGNKFFELQFK